ncbi:cation:proton antiporter [Mycolicibacterium mucogenicum]|uniref:cation:proton antiporter n=1 Tax=Mycolicibacterium mucogenicum TaxID=56689 RepID=UPI00076ABC01|nr:cation:proton antiporter [Mycolicibacterium mucogenicum]
MRDFGFHALALVAVIGLVGPLLAAVPKLRVPLIVGELAAGIVVGRTGFGIVDADNPTFVLLADIGFALVMFIVGTHVPVRDRSLRGELPRSLLRAVVVGAFAAVLGAVIAQLFGTGHAPLYAVLMASSSAALALPVIQSLGLTGPPVLSVTAQIAIADAASIVLLPLVINPAGAPRAAVGVLAIAACAVLLYFLLRYEAERGWLKRMHKYSHRRHLALELRISLIVLFALGLCLSAIGEPRRLARQLFGITEGFFAPLFFVWLGASLQVRELGEHPGLIGLGAALGVGAVLAHLSGRLFGQPLSLGVLAAAQLGVPVAAATLGTQQQLLSPGEPSALILGALLTVVATSVAGGIARRRQTSVA